MQAATLTSVLPVTAGGTRQNLRAGATVPTVAVPVEFDIVLVSPGYFATLGVPLVSGRDFSRSDAPKAAPVVIVNEAMARTFWPGADPVGSAFSTAAPVPYTVIGVARDTKYRNLREKTRMVMYLPMSQQYVSAANLVVRTSLPAAQIVDGASALLFAVALLGSFIPAWRATRIDPVVALRQR